MIYLIRAGNLNSYQIDCAQSARERIDVMQPDYIEEIRLVGTWEGNEKDAEQLRKRYADFRLRGHWFSLTDKQVVDLVIEMNQRVHERDTATGAVWADAICGLLQEKGCDPSEAVAVIASATVRGLAQEIQKDPTINYKQAWDLLRSVIGVGAMKHTRKVKHPCRGLLWVGQDADANDTRAVIER